MPDPASVPNVGELAALLMRGNDSGGRTASLRGEGQRERYALAGRDRGGKR